MFENSTQGAGLTQAYYEKLLRSADIAHEDVWTTYQYKCPTGGKPPKVEHREACKLLLWEELTIIRPRTVLAFGVGPISLLLRRKQNEIILDDIMGKWFREPYLPGGETVVIPLPSIERLCRGAMELTLSVVDILKEFVDA